MFSYDLFFLTISLFHTRRESVVLDHDGLRSGGFGWTGTLFTSQTTGKDVPDHDGLGSGNFGRTETFFTSHTTSMIVLDDDGLRSAFMAG